MITIELMIGDWVQLKGHLDYDKVQEIAMDENMNWYISFACSATLFRAYEYEPIPLTAEILEKNGFTKDENCGYCIWLDKHLVAINLETHNLAVESILIAAEVQIADNYIHIPALPVHYVHELQKALRCCGLWDLVNNFKI